MPNLSNSLYLVFERNRKCSSQIKFSECFTFPKVSLPAPQCTVHISATTQHLTTSPPLTSFLVIPDSSLAWPSNLKQTVEQNRSLVIIFLTTQTLNIPPLIFSSTTVTVTTSFCFSVSSIVAKLSWLGISICSFIRKFHPCYHNELFTSLIWLVIRVAMSVRFILDIVSNYINSVLNPYLPVFMCLFNPP